MRALLALALVLAACSSSAALVADAPESLVDGGAGAVGAICAGAPDSAVAVTCAPGLACCYPCGIPGCANQCEPTCHTGDPGCAGGCLQRP